MLTSSKRTLAPGKKIRVLVVDDSVVIRRLVTQALKQTLYWKSWERPPMAPWLCRKCPSSVPM